MSKIAVMKRIWRSERGFSKLSAFVTRASERFAGRYRALLYGWQGGFIGRAPRIIGTTFIAAQPGCSVGRFAWIEVVPSETNRTPILEIGAKFSASERLHVACVNHIRIGQDCLIGSGVHITDHNHGKYTGQDQSDPMEAPIKRHINCDGAVEIGSNVWIGDNVVIIGPVVIGAGAIIGANSVVTKNVPINTIVVGAPAVPVKYYDERTMEWKKCKKID
ncbi:MAG: acyltransferase [Sphingorhabdus sp.]|uniref:DapH/DapD/GlmU-related protein n=1 Tax=Sphingorhabdus sp. TaxID=1902408 RepID=UPI0026008DC6|nr:DapH/DapD/GlmU-related protein [Sphingorhabdus sp.]MCO4090762.1 acyltransferase [Sphingorhabdus sp.]